jgi:hypothetical protein
LGATSTRPEKSGWIADCPGAFTVPTVLPEVYRSFELTRQKLLILSGLSSLIDWRSYDPTAKKKASPPRDWRGLRARLNMASFVKIEGLPDGVGLFLGKEKRYRRPIVLTERQLRARRANMAKARTFACQANIQVRTGLRPE